MIHVHIKVFGIGDAGCHMITQMLEKPLGEVDYMAVNTNASSLHAFPQHQRLLIGETLTKGYGAGADPEAGKRAALVAQNSIRTQLEKRDMVILCAGLGGGTGSGTLPVIARLAKEMQALTIAFVTLPFPFEGKKRSVCAQAALAEIYGCADTCITLSNQHILQHLGSSPITETFRIANSIIQQGIQALYELIMIPVYINVDYADIKAVMEKQRHGFIGVGYGKGEQRSKQAVQQALSARLLEHGIQGLQHAIVHICVCADVSLEEVQQTIMQIHEAAGINMDIIFGMAVNEKLQEEMIVTILAAGA